MSNYGENSPAKTRCGGSEADEEIELISATATTATIAASVTPTNTPVLDGGDSSGSGGEVEPADDDEPFEDPLNSTGALDSPDPGSPGPLSKPSTPLKQQGLLGVLAPLTRTK